jgi:hypothetical protein
MISTPLGTVVVAGGLLKPVRSSECGFISSMQNYWASKGCAVLQSSNTEVSPLQCWMVVVEAEKNPGGVV